ncbi:MAG: patatin-like phospholipase family protein [bacterium]
MKFFNKKTKNKKIGLALGGGAVLGAAHIGVLKALEEHNISISYISGTSIGAFIGAFYAFGKSWKEIEEITKDLKWLNVSGLSVPKLGLLSNKKLGDVIKDNIGDETIEQADIPIAIVATDITSGEKVVFKKGSVSTAVMASTCIPGIFIPVENNDRLLVDGGIVENVPVMPLKEMGADFIISVDLNAEHAHKKPENIVEVLLRSFDFILKSATKVQTEEADILIKPDLSPFNMVDMDQADDLIETGYTEAKKLLRKIT